MLISFELRIYLELSYIGNIEWIVMGSGRAFAWARPEKPIQRPGPKPGPTKKRTARPEFGKKNWNFDFWTNFWRSRDRQMAMKKFKYLDITLYEWPEFEVSPFITFPCKNNLKTNMKYTYIEGSSGFLIGPGRAFRADRSYHWIAFTCSKNVRMNFNVKYICTRM